MKLSENLTFHHDVREICFIQTIIYSTNTALAKEGREACIQYGHYQVLPRCLEIEAECRHFMGDDEISKELYYQSYYLCKVIGYQIGLEVVKKEAKEYLNIDFMS